MQEITYGMMQDVDVEIMVTKPVMFITLKHFELLQIITQLINAVQEENIIKYGPFIDGNNLSVNKSIAFLKK